MKKVVLVCNAGISNSLLVEKLNTLAKEGNKDLVVVSSSLVEVKENAKEADLVLLTPQVRFEEDKVKAETSAKVEVIAVESYENNDADAVLEFAEKLLK